MRPRSHLAAPRRAAQTLSDVRYPRSSYIDGAGAPGVGRLTGPVAPDIIQTAIERGKAIHSFLDSAKMLVLYSKKGLTIAKTTKSAMTAERKEQGSTRQSILQLLRRHGEMTALDLSEQLCVGAVGVRQHLALLEREGMVRVAGLRRSVGRPSHLYTLTQEAEERFPKHYDRFALELLTYLHATGGDEAVDQVLASRREALARDLRPHLAGKSRRDQVATLAAILAEQGYMCEWEEDEDGSFVLTEYNCPVDCVARRHQQLCIQEAALYEDLLGVPVSREGTIAQGSPCCRYRIPAQA